jgi:DNA-binding NarL/FixJ family response regulator
MEIKLAIVDDDVRLSKNLKSDLLEFEEVESVITSTSGLKFAKDLEQMSLGKRPDCIIMDISMGSPDEGVIATRIIKSQFPAINVVMFTIVSEDDLIFEAFKAGAMGYLLKNEPPAFILKTIIDVQNGGAQMSPIIARKAINFFMPAAPLKINAQSIHDLEKLSVRELEILEQVAKGLTYKQIAADFSLSLNTVKKHMENIFGKLQAKNKIEALKKAEGVLKS